MSDIIQLLPDSVANQIAAGEVIQRPASALKELLENAIDSGANTINVILKDAGKTLIQVIDNGCGMSETDARMCFERHATSKIKNAEDLFAIRTMGFRGEALASIAAIAQVELKTKRTEDELGVMIEMNGSKVESQAACSCANGTNISVKNLFYNIPARRNFLKSNPVETRHILDEFQRVALAHPDLGFTFNHNGIDVYHLIPGTFKQRIVALFGNLYNERMVAVDESTTIIEIKGFVGKPEVAKKTRGEQYFFVNKRFIKDGYLNHAVQSAFQDLLPPGSYPSYFLFIDINPAKIDINIHPTKTEIKFEDERSVYAIVKASVKRALGQYSVMPSMDFDIDRTLNIPVITKDTVITQPSINLKPGYNPFNTEEENAPSSQQWRGEPRQRIDPNWQKLYEGLDIKAIEKEAAGLDLQSSPNQQQAVVEWDEESIENTTHIFFQLFNKYIVTPVRSGLMVIDQQAAHERVLYERYLQYLTKNQGLHQQQLFPQTIEFSAIDFALVTELEEEIRALGFDIKPFGKNTFVVHGVPSDIQAGEEKEMIEGLLEQYKNNESELKLDKRENLARSIAYNLAIKSGKPLSIKEMKHLTDELFACDSPTLAPNGKPVLMMINEEEFAKRFSK